MFPVDSFQFVFCGLATLAASVGYACTRNLSSGLRSKPTHNPTEQASCLHHEDLEKSTSHSSKESASFGRLCEDATTVGKTPSIPIPVSLKRKHSEDNCPEDSHTVSSSPPTKRSRTPSTDGDSDLVQTPPLAHSLILAPVAPSIKPLCDMRQADNSSKPSSVDESATPPIFPSSLPRLLSRPGTPPTQFHKPRPGDGFAAFATSSSSFGTTANGPPSSFIKEKPIWYRGSEDHHQLSQDPLAAEIHSKTTYTHVTGEEAEDVESELKGVKLFVNRGGKGFGDGMIGHIKLLSNKQIQSDRLLFRRDPLWQVSMNVALNPFVRCTFDEEACALRLILKESTEPANVLAGQQLSEVVIYVLKRGRATKEAFREFAESLLGNSHLNPQCR